MADEIRQEKKRFGTGIGIRVLTQVTSGKLYMAVIAVTTLCLLSDKIVTNFIKISVLCVKGAISLDQATPILSMYQNVLMLIVGGLLSFISMVAGLYFAKAVTSDKQDPSQVSDK